MIIAMVVAFLNEERYLDSTLGSIAAQTRVPDRLLLVDDGSIDDSLRIASDFAARHDYARALERPRRATEADRLATAAELRAFQFGVEQLDVPYDVVVKLDGDLELKPSHVAEMEKQFADDPRLGIAGSFLSVRLPDGRVRREQFPLDYVLGPNRFYRRECFEAISPLPAVLGWDAIDVVRARMYGWHTQTFELTDGDSIHLRPTGSHGGHLRAYRRWGECQWGVGSHPLNVLAGAVWRARQRPYVLGGANYLAGWALAAARRAPRADPAERAFKRQEDLQRIRRIVSPRRSRQPGGQLTDHG